MTPDWTPPTAPVLTVDPPKGTTVTLRWTAATDNVGVVGYDVLRDGKVIARADRRRCARYKDLNVPPGMHTWRVRSRYDDAGNCGGTPRRRRQGREARRRGRRVVSLQAWSETVAAAPLRYSLAGRGAPAARSAASSARCRRPSLRLYVQSGRGASRVWRGTPGSSSPRLRLASALARHGYVTIHLGRTLHAGRIRLVLITSGHMVIVGTGKHKPSIEPGERPRRVLASSPTRRRR